MIFLEIPRDFYNFAVGLYYESNGLSRFFLL